MSEMTLKERLEIALGSPVVGMSPLPVGFGLTGRKLILADGRCLAVKARDRGSHASLEIEAYMLGELERLSELPVPHVHFADPDLLVMDFIETDGAPITPKVERRAAELIAQLHAIPMASFGYARGTLIGPLAQPNPESPCWIPFFREHRLMHMARAAQQEGQLPLALLMRLERLGERLEDYLFEPPFPSLLHGDLWTGNVLVSGDRIAGFIDPAISCGHPEIELAFTTLFGTFGRAFFDAYAALQPLEPGFHTTRLSLYNLYPTLVHVRLFGAGYLAGIEQALVKLGL
jgi:fructosamine-3-kinase